jgi:hypothetical protein
MNTRLIETDTKVYNEGSFHLLPSTQQKQIKQFETIIGGKCEVVWDKANVFIVAIKLQNHIGSYRFDVDTMNKLIQAKAHWVEEDLGSRVNIGF